MHEIYLWPFLVPLGGYILSPCGSNQISPTFISYANLYNTNIGPQSEEAAHMLINHNHLQASFDLFSLLYIKAVSIFKLGILELSYLASPKHQAAPWEIRGNKEKGAINWGRCWVWLFKDWTMVSLPRFLAHWPVEWASLGHPGFQGTSWASHSTPSAVEFILTPETVFHQGR